VRPFHLSALLRPYEGVRTLAAEMFTRMEPWVKRGGEYAEWTVTQPISWDDIQVSANELVAATNIRLSEIKNLQNKSNDASQKKPR